MLEEKYLEQANYRIKRKKLKLGAVEKVNHAHESLRFKPKSDLEEMNEESPIVFDSLFAASKKRKHVIRIKDPDVLQFLRFVVEGRQDRAEAMLKKNPLLVLGSGSVTDLSNRYFKCISGFQYACWALDWKMWRMILKYMSTFEASDQLKDLEENGTEHGRHFSLNPLLAALDTYIKNYDAWCKEENFQEMIRHWCQEVGGHQLGLPVNVAQEYCNSRHCFDPCPDFREDIRDESLMTDLGNWYASAYQGGKLGEKFAFLRGSYRQASGLDNSTKHYIGKDYPKKDAAALRSLLKVRQMQLEELKENLRKHEINHFLLRLPLSVRGIVHQYD